MPKSVAVVGGGLAGLSCAVALAEAGLQVRLLERRPHLGGRATSYLLPSGEHVDNCQHVTLGCCVNLSDFYRRVGAAHHIRWYDRVFFLDRDGRRGVLQPSFFPPPLHLAPSFALFPSLDWGDKLAIARVMWRITWAGGRPADAAGVTMLDWLRRHGQTPQAIERFWRTVLVSALDEELDRAGARYSIDVFWKGFLACREGFPMGIPAVPLAELYDGCRGAIEQRGGEVKTRAGVREVRFAEDVAVTVALDDGSVIPADFVVLAVPHDAVAALLPPELAARDPFAGLRNLRVSPITGVHFWFDRPVMREPFLTLLDRTVQWVFNKSALSTAATGNGQYLQLVISASYDLVARSRQEIIDLCAAELRQALPATREAQLTRATVIKEVAATFSPAPDCDPWRPPSRTPVANLFLAGDWTQTGWPATMEGAVRSGYLAAESILAAGNRPVQFLQPDLAPRAFARLFAPRTA
jgi:zeta-carotene desaturase